MHLPRFGTGLALTAALVAIGVCTVEAQQAPETLARVTVVDTMGRGVAGADVSVVSGVAMTVAHAMTDASGIATLTIQPDGDYQIVVRRIGFLRAAQFFKAGGGVSQQRLVLFPVAQTLAGVKVTAQADAKRRSYHVDSDDIAASERPIIDALDILTKMRPDMITPRAPAGLDPCGAEKNIWVNGKRIVYPPTNDVMAEKARMLKLSKPNSGMSLLPVDVISVLASIHPEHVSEINFTDCNDFTVERSHARNAIFVSLKPGVAFEAGRGTYVLPTESSGMAFRTRVLGVFDEVTGDPVSGANVVDTRTGTYATTTETGTASLAFLAEGPATLVIRKPGYEQLRLDVTITPRDSLPITLTVKPAKQ